MLEENGIMAIGYHLVVIGDDTLSRKDSRQVYSFIGGYKYIEGPTGPLSKNLMRLEPCESAQWWNFWKVCNVRNDIEWLGLNLKDSIQYD